VGVSSNDSEPIVVTYRGVDSTFIPVNSGIEPKLRQGRFYESTMLDYIASLGLSGVYVDVGGYIGSHAVFFAQHCPSTTVHTFEPSPAMFPALTANLAANGLEDRVVAHNAGLSDHSEVIDFSFEGRDERFACERLDAVIAGPVTVLKVDVEGLEPKVLAGAARLLSESRPLVFVEAHSREALARDLALLEPYGYRATGRVFNASPTYELVADGSPCAPPERLPHVIDLLTPEMWSAVSPGLATSWSEGRLTISSPSTPPERLHVTQVPASLRHRSHVERPATPRGDLFFQMVGEATEGMGVSIHFMEFTGAERIRVTRRYFYPRMFEHLELHPETDGLRIAIGVSGAGELTIERIAFHIPKASAVPIADILSRYVEARAVIVDLTLPAADVSSDAILPPQLGVHYRRELADVAGEAAAKTVVLQQLDRDVRLELDGASGEIVHVVFATLLDGVIDRGLLDQAARGGWEIAGIHAVVHDVFRFAIVLVRDVRGRARHDLRVLNEYRFDKALLRERDQGLERATARATRAQKQAEEHEREAQAASADAAQARRRAAGLEQELRSLAATLTRTREALVRARSSVSFRVGRATRVALRGRGIALLNAPRRWLETFRGPDEGLNDLDR
jgi:FkbM family methyltransferase